MYDLLLGDLLSLSTYLLLAFAVLSLWVKSDPRIWGSLALLSVICGYLANRVDIIGILVLLVLGLLFFTVRKRELPVYLRVIAGVLVFVLSLAIEDHLLPGFNNWKILNKIRLSELSIPYSMHFNLDKTFMGLFILGIGFPLITDLREWPAMLKTTLLIFVPGLIILVTLTILFKYTAWDVKFPEIFWVWACKNLLFTCVAEEGLYRGFVQRNLTDIFQGKKYGNILSLSIASIIFGLAHYWGGPWYVVFAVVAGFVYGYAYHKTGRIEASLLCHLGVNSFHIIFLTYPALMPA